MSRTNLFTSLSKSNPKKIEFYCFGLLAEKCYKSAHSFKIIIPVCSVVASFLLVMIPCLSHLFILYSTVQTEPDRALWNISLIAQKHETYSANTVFQILLLLCQIGKLPGEGSYCKKIPVVFMTARYSLSWYPDNKLLASYWDIAHTQRKLYEGKSINFVVREIWSKNLLQSLIC